MDQLFSGNLLKLFFYNKSKKALFGHWHRGSFWLLAQMAPAKRGGWGVGQGVLGPLGGGGTPN